MAKGKLRHIHVEPADNGVMVTARHEPGKVQKGPFMLDEHEKKTVHKTAAEAGAHVTKVLKEAGHK